MPINGLVAHKPCPLALNCMKACNTARAAKGGLRERSGAKGGEGGEGRLMASPRAASIPVGGSGRSRTRTPPPPESGPAHPGTVAGRAARRAGGGRKGEGGTREDRARGGWGKRKSASICGLRGGEQGRDDQNGRHEVSVKRGGRRAASHAAAAAAAAACPNANPSAATGSSAKPRHPTSQFAEGKAPRLGAATHGSGNWGEGLARTNRVVGGEQVAEGVAGHQRGTRGLIQRAGTRHRPEGVFAGLAKPRAPQGPGHPSTHHQEASPPSTFDFHF